MGCNTSTERPSQPRRSSSLTRQNTPHPGKKNFFDAEDVEDDDDDESNESKRRRAPPSRLSEAKTTSFSSEVPSAFCEDNQEDIIDEQIHVELAADGDIQVPGEYNNEAAQENSKVQIE